MSRPTSILIAGPTASGKSGLAMSLAEKLDGVVINADSMQVYRNLRILTARPSLADEARVPHALYGHIDGAEAYSTGRYARDAKIEIDKATAAGRVPIIVGGTGLYFRALLDGLSPIPAIPHEIRLHWREEATRLGAAALHVRLQADDPVMAARLQPADRQRVTRALEVWHATGRSLAEWQSVQGEPIIAQETAQRLSILPERALLRSRCDERFEAMMEGGALDEVRDLALLNLSTELPIMSALGVAPLIQHLRGELSRDEAISVAKAETRQYVKRQTTWLRRNMISWTPVSTE